MNFTAIHVNDPRFTESLWKRLFELHCTIRDKYNSLLAASSYRSLKRQLSALVQSAEKNYYFVILEKEHPVGWVSLRVDRDTESRTVGNMFSDHIYDSLPKGFSSAVASELLRITREIDCREIVCEAIHDRVAMLLESLGGRKMGRLDRYRLYRNEANMVTINGWLESFPQRYSGNRVIFFEAIPEDHAQAYVNLINQFIEDIPAEREGPVPQLSVETIRSREAARRKRGLHLYTVAILDQKDQMIGHSSASIQEQNPVGGYQSMTGIERAFRGRGFSKWLKAELFARVGQLHPDNEYLNVDMRAINEPILRVNRAMGYKLFYRGHEYLVEPDDLQRAVQS